jgi:type IV pilus assembly protein PilB
MSAETNLDADAFMRKYLECPSDATARLVFADWLEETGEPRNRAWAYFIRLKYEADLYPFGSRERRELDRQADGYAEKIRARLTIPASLFVGYPKSLLQLLPAPNISVRLAEFVVPRSALELVPESVARENLVIPIDAQERALLIAAVYPSNYDTVQKLQFILNRDIVSVGAERDDMQAALDREYGATETESVDSVLVEFVDTAIDFGPAPDEFETDVAPVVRRTNLMLQEAINLRADRILMFPEPGSVALRYRIDDEWVDRDGPPLRLLRHIARRLAIMAAIPIEWTFANPPSLTPMTGNCFLQVSGGHYRLRVTIQPSPDGPTTQIDLVRESPRLSDR